MTHDETSTDIAAAPGPEASLEKLLADQRTRWQRGERIPTEMYLARYPSLAGDAALDLIGNELLLRLELGEKPLLAEFTHRFPQWATQIKIQFEVELAIAAQASQAATHTGSDATHVPASSGPRPAGDGTLPHIPGYEIVHEIARGGQSVVYLARQVSLDRLVALKMIHGGAAADSEERSRFRREAEAVAHLKHANVVQIHDIGQHDEQPFIAMEYVAGDTLAKKIAGTPQPPRHGAGLIETLARTMHEAHQHGIVHRDLKPGNILLQKDEGGRRKDEKEKRDSSFSSFILPLSSFTPKITDFGLAKRLQADSHLTHTGHIMGTPAYMAPEQAAGKNKDVGPAADVYALGVILYEMLTGRPPYLGETAWDVISQVIQGNPVPPRRLQPKVPRELETICLKCMRQDSGQRYASARDLADDLQRYLNNQPIHARPVGVLGRLVLWCRRKPTIAAALALGLIAALLVCGHEVLQERQRQRQLRATNAARLVERLLDANITQVPDIIREIEPYRREADPLLRGEKARAAKGSRQELHTSLALLPVDRAQAIFLGDRLVEPQPQGTNAAEILVLREALVPHRTELLPRLWASTAIAGKGQENVRLRAACALALYDPHNPRWDQFSSTVIEDAIAVNPVFLGLWMDGVRPVSGRLLTPLAQVFRDAKRRETARMLAANVLLDFAAEQPVLLADLLLDADDKQFNLIFPKLKPTIVARFESEIDKRPEATELSREQLAKRQANAAAALLRMNQPARVWPLLQHRPDPRVRSYAIDRFAALGVDGKTIVSRLEVETDVSIQRALILSLGEFEWPMAERAALVTKMRHLHDTAADPGLNAAAEWLLRQLGDERWLEQTDVAWVKDRDGRGRQVESITKNLSAGNAGPQWYVNGQGLKMIVLPGPVEFLMGSPLSEAGRYADEWQHPRRINRTFALAAKPVTVKQYLQFRPKFAYNTERAPSPECPMNSANMYDAAAYCNWLSKQEEIPEKEWCYDLTDDGRANLRKNYWHLRGYRLPSGPEWEYACRAGAVTSRYFGESDELLDKYAWSLRNSNEPSWPVGSKKPNDFGLFDMHGNVWCWCQESYEPDRPMRGDKQIEDDEDVLSIAPTALFVLRGGSFRSHPKHLRSARRDTYEPTTRISHLGFRPARTFR